MRTHTLFLAVLILSIGSCRVAHAADPGLGTTWVGNFDPAKVIKEFKLPANIIPVAVLPLGYPATEAKKNPLHFEKLPAESIVFHRDFSTLK